MNIAIVAHFDVQNKFSDNFLLLLEVLQCRFDLITVVSTSAVEEKSLGAMRKVRLIKRPNIGYDFYSHRVGISSLRSLQGINKLFLLNSSITIVDQSLFAETIDKMLHILDANEVVGVTESSQIEWHLQSYLIGFDKSILLSAWFEKFIHSIEPQDDKFSIIYKYEIGLSKEIKKHKHKASVIFKPSTSQKIVAQLKWLKVVAKIENLKVTTFYRAFRHLKSLNQLHFCADYLAEACGFIKNEVLEKNPHNLKIKKKYSPYIVSGKEINPFEGRFKNLSMPFRTCSIGIKPQINKKIAVLIHLYYFDLFEEILDSLDELSDDFDLHVTTPFEGDVVRILDKARIKSNSIAIYIFENRGRDIGPFVSLYLAGIFDDYKAVLKLHSKKSKYSEKGDDWRKLLYKKIIGGTIKSRKIAEIFLNPRVGIVGPGEYYLTNHKYWGANYITVCKLLSLCGFSSLCSKKSLGFFAGSMFWFNPRSLSSLKLLENSYLEFESENGKQDGTLAHAFERLFCQIARSSGYEILTTDLKALDNSKAPANTVPVL